jgi:hypothetical protein
LISLHPQVYQGLVWGPVALPEGITQTKESFKSLKFPRTF